MTKEQYEFGVKYYDVMHKIVVNHSYSAAPIEFLEFLKKSNYTHCNCNSGIISGVLKFYNDWLSYEESNTQKQDTTTNKNSVTKNKRKSKSSV